METREEKDRNANVAHSRLGATTSTTRLAYSAHNCTEPRVFFRNIIVLHRDEF